MLVQLNSIHGSILSTFWLENIFLFNYVCSLNLKSKSFPRNNLMLKLNYIGYYRLLWFKLIFWHLPIIQANTNYSFSFSNLIFFILPPIGFVFVVTSVSLQTSCRVSIWKGEQRLGRAQTPLYIRQEKRFLLQQLNCFIFENGV